MDFCRQWLTSCTSKKLSFQWPLACCFNDFIIVVFIMMAAAAAGHDPLLMWTEPGAHFLSLSNLRSLLESVASRKQVAHWIPRPSSTTKSDRWITWRPPDWLHGPANQLSNAEEEIFSRDNSSLWFESHLFRTFCHSLSDGKIETAWAIAATAWGQNTMVTYYRPQPTTRHINNGQRK